MNQMAANPGSNTVVFCFGATQATQFAVEGTNEVVKKRTM
jgi:hypothetical protein